MSKTPEINLPALVKQDGQVLLKDVRFGMEKCVDAERRLAEARLVNTATYAELEYLYNEGYRELKKNMAIVGHEIMKAEKALDNIKAEVLFDKYPDFIKDKPKSFDNAETRKSYISRDADYQKALDHLNNLKMIETLLDGKIKVLERVTAYMKKQIDILMKTGQMPNYVR